MPIHQGFCTLVLSFFCTLLYVAGTVHSVLIERRCLHLMGVLIEEFHCYSIFLLTLAGFPFPAALASRVDPSTLNREEDFALFSGVDRTGLLNDLL